MLFMSTCPSSFRTVQARSVWENVHWKKRANRRGIEMRRTASVASLPCWTDRKWLELCKDRVTLCFLMGTDIKASWFWHQFLLFKHLYSYEMSEKWLTWTSTWSLLLLKTTQNLTRSPDERDTLTQFTHYNPTHNTHQSISDCTLT